MLDEMLGVELLRLLILSAVLTICLCRPILRTSGRLFGWYLRRKTNARRHRILSRIETEERAYRPRECKPREDEDWENVDNELSGAPQEEKSKPPVWEGVIGFFHPFW